MVELTQQQSQILAEQGGGPVELVDPQTNTAYVLITAEMYEQMRKLLDGFTKSAGWDDPELDVYEQHRKKA